MTLIAVTEAMIRIHQWNRPAPAGERCHRNRPTSLPAILAAPGRFFTLRSRGSPHDNSRRGAACIHGPMRRLATIAVCGYAAAITALWLTVDLLSDRLWPATLIAFGPRWPAALPLLPLALLVVVATPARVGRRLIGIIGLTGLVLVFGFMDLRLGLEREPGTPVLRIMTDNVGGGNVTAQALDRLMRAEQVDVAALQECPFYDYDMARLGWRFYYSGDLCLVSRYPFVVLDEREPEEKWRRGGHEPDRFEIDAPIGRFQLLNVHLGTIRGGLEALRDGSWHALPLFDGNREEASARISRRSSASHARNRANRSCGRLQPAGRERHLSGQLG